MLGGQVEARINVRSSYSPMVAHHDDLVSSPVLLVLPLSYPVLILYLQRLNSIVMSGSFSTLVSHCSSRSCSHMAGRLENFSVKQHITHRPGLW